MKTIALFLLSFALLFCLQLAQAQPDSPGGVPGFALWGMVESLENGAAFRIRSASDDKAYSLKKEETSLFNFNQALHFGNGEQPFQIPLGAQDFSKLTIFTVHHPADPLAEKSVWSLEKNGSPYLLLTTDRMADIESVSFMNLVDARKDAPVIHVYHQFMQSDSAASSLQTLILGGKTASPEIPILPFFGKLAEIIVFDRVLSSVEQQQVESYLAIKYGIPLSPNSSGNYLNAKRETIRDGKKHRAFSHRVTGIGRDDLSGLHQKQSANSYDPELLVVGAGQIAGSNAENFAVLPDHSFLLWGDDNAPFALAPKEQGKPRMAARKWMLTAFGATQNIAAEMSFDVRRMVEPLKEGEIWWLAIDRSGTGQFPTGEVEYFPVHHVTPAGKAVFQGIQWDADGSGSDLLSIGAAPEMMPVFWVNPPLCAPAADGKISMGAAGGKPPYTFELTSLSNNFHRKWTLPDNRLEEVNGIRPGDYSLVVSDVSGKVHRDTIFVQSGDALVSKMAAQYWLMPGEILSLDASEGLPENGIEYRWTGADGFYSTSPQAQISAPGIYRLTISKDGCESRKEITVGEYSTGNFSRIELFPNPAPGGSFQLAVNLHRAANVEVRISDALGKVVFAQTLQDSDYYKSNIRLATPPGVYVVTVVSEKTTRSFKLVVG